MFQCLKYVVIARESRTPEVGVDEVFAGVLGPDHGGELASVGLPHHRRPDILAFDQSTGFIGASLDAEDFGLAVRPDPPEGVERKLHREAHPGGPVIEQEHIRDAVSGGGLDGAPGHAGDIHLHHGFELSAG